LGILEDKTHREKLASLSRWHSTRSTTDMISFDDYIAKMKPVQDQIYYFSGEDRSVLEKSPLVVGLVRRGYEVILCDDPIDEYVFNTLREYEKKVIFYLISRISLMLVKEILKCQMMTSSKERNLSSLL